MTVQKYKIIERFDEDYSIDTVPVPWNLIPEEVASKIPGWYYTNVLAATKDGEIVQKTVVFFNPVYEFDPDAEVYQMYGGKILVQLGEE